MQPQKTDPHYRVYNKIQIPAFVSFRKRAPYIAYLTRCRQGLQTSQAHLERLLQRVLRDKEVANRYFTTVCVRLLLEHMESKMLDFIKGISTFSSYYLIMNITSLFILSFLQVAAVHCTCSNCVSASLAFQGCTASDDKTAAVEDFLRYLYGAMASDAIWQYASEDQLQDAQMAIERSVMNRIFKLAFYPNQDGDILRDQ